PAAIDNAKLAYQVFQESSQGPRWEALAARGARVQRPLWASTSTKNPAYRDVLYVEELIARDTVNTMPLETIEAFADHGEVRGQTATQALDRARGLWSDLAALGIDEDEVGYRLEREGVEKFADGYNGAGETIQAKARRLGRRWRKTPARGAGGSGGSRPRRPWGCSEAPATWPTARSSPPSTTWSCTGSCPRTSPSSGSAAASSPTRSTGPTCARRWRSSPAPSPSSTRCGSRSPASSTTSPGRRRTRPPTAVSATCWTASTASRAPTATGCSTCRSSPSCSPTPSGGSARPGWAAAAGTGGTR